MRCFVVHSNKIEERIDPFYYQPEFVKQSESLGSNTKAIREIAKVICGPFGSSITVKDYSNNGIPLIRICNIKDGELNTENIVFITKELANKLKSYAVKEGDLIISQRGTLGLVAKIPLAFNNAVISANFIAIKDITKISPEFLQFYLSSAQGQLQITRRTSGQVQTKITTDDIKSIKVPMLQSQLQNRIVLIMQSAYTQKKQKEQEAQQLLGSINNYVLDELGIQFSESEIEEDKIYCVDSEELENRRYDPYYFNPKFIRLLADLEKSKIKFAPLKEVATELFNGKTPAKEDYAEEGNFILKVSCLKNNKIVWDKLSFVKNTVPLVKAVKDKDILLLSSAHQSDYLGKNPSIVEKPNNLINEKIYFVGELINIRPNIKKINPYYLLAILKLNKYYLLVNREKRGQTSHLYPDDLGNVKIPLPLLAVQNKIAEEVKSRMQKAEQLQKESKEELEKAKQEVEKLILGE